MKIDPFTRKSGVEIPVYALIQLHLVEKSRPQDFGRYVDIDNY